MSSFPLQPCIQVYSNCTAAFFSNFKIFIFFFFFLPDLAVKAESWNIGCQTVSNEIHRGKPGLLVQPVIAPERAHRPPDAD
jgi:hypothetical protein